MSVNDAELNNLLALLFQAHPWHGVAPGDETPHVIKAYIEIVPTDTVKYELDKASGHLRLDRPQRLSSLPPTLYGFIPQTYCGDEIAELCRLRTDRQPGSIHGDGDPLDICVLTEKSFSHGDFFIRAKPVGGLRMIDNVEADDKIIAVLDGDVAFGHIDDLSQVPDGLITRLQHYFLTYKQLPHEAPRRVEIAQVYDRAEAHDVIARSLRDYRAKFGAPESRLSQLRRMMGQQTVASSQ